MVNIEIRRQLYRDAQLYCLKLIEHLLSVFSNVFIRQLKKPQRPILESEFIPQSAVRNDRKICENIKKKKKLVYAFTNAYIVECRYIPSNAIYIYIYKETCM